MSRKAWWASWLQKAPLSGYRVMWRRYAGLQLLCADFLLLEGVGIVCGDLWVIDSPGRLFENRKPTVKKLDLASFFTTDYF
jgi:hypothetical protein